MSQAVLHVTGTPRPKQGARFVGGRVVSVARANKGLRLWTDSIVSACRRWRRAGGQPFGGAVDLEVDFYFATRDRDRWGRHHLPRPDADNLLKALMDALQKGGLLVDDSRVPAPKPRKWWARDAGAVIVLRDLGADDAGADDDDDLGARPVDGDPAEALS